MLQPYCFIDIKIKKKEMLDVFICSYETALHVKAVDLCAAPDATQGNCNKKGTGK